MYFVLKLESIENSKKAPEAKGLRNKQKRTNCFCKHYGGKELKK